MGIMVLRSIMVPMVIVIYGCGVAMEFDVSVPDGIPAGAQGEIREESIELRLRGLNISLALQNYRATGFALVVWSATPVPPFLPYPVGPGQLQGPLQVWVKLEPEGDAFLFDPAKLVVSVGNKENIGPMGFVGPATPWKYESPRAVGKGCGERIFSMGIAMSRVDFEREVTKTVEGPLSLKGPTCFVLWYAVDSTPEQDFAVSIRGLEKAGETIEIPEIKLKKGSVWKNLVTP